jgi:hypothetical protein
MRRNRLAALTVALLAVSCLLFVWRKSSARVVAASVSQATRPETRGELGDQSLSDTATARSHADASERLDRSKIAVGAFLADYFGARWQEVREATRPSSEFLESMIDPALIPRWGDVEPQMLDDLRAATMDSDDRMQQALSWDGKGLTTDQVDFSTRDFNPKGKALSMADVEQIRAVVKAVDQDIRDLAQQRARYEYEALMVAFKKGQYEKAPLLRVMPAHLRHGHIASLKVMSADNWNMAIGFLDGDSAEYDAANTLIQEMRRSRFDKARQLIAGR